MMRSSTLSNRILSPGSWLGCLLLLGLLSLGLGNLYAQENLYGKKLFVRVYDHSGTKIGKGVLLSGDASGLKLYQGKKEHFYSVKDIGKLRTRRSAGHNVLVGAAIGALAWGTVEAVGNDSFWVSRENAFMAGVIGGSVLGGVAGGITNVFKNTRKYMIQGEPEALEAFLQAVQKR